MITKEELEKEAEEYAIKQWEGNLPWSVIQKSYYDGALSREKRIADLEKENADLKCECRRCVYTDCPCVLSDYGKDKDGICDHFKDVFDENADLKEQCSILADCNTCVSDCKTENIEIKTQLTKAKELLERLLITSCNSDVLNLLPNCSEVLRVRAEAEQFLSEVEK